MKSLLYGCDGHMLDGLPLTFSKLFVLHNVFRVVDDMYILNKTISNSKNDNDTLM